MAKLGVAVPEDAEAWGSSPPRSEAAETGKQEGSSLSLSLVFPFFGLSKSICCLLFAEFNGKLAVMGPGSWSVQSPSQVEIRE